jgi:murein DD-endopeptidase MepM/ murein hydrolase activator NlpD
LAIKTLKLLGRLITKISRLFTGFFSLIFKLLFKRLLVKIYFEFFRLRKTRFQQKDHCHFFKRNLAYLSIIVLTVILILSNMQNKNQAKAATENRISKTIMASLVENQFSSLSFESEELVKDSYVPSNQSVEQEKYYPDSMATIEKQAGLLNNEIEKESTDPILVNEEALAVKPKSINLQTNENDENFSTQRQEIVNYTVQKGDTISSIAQHFGVTINTVLWANDLASYSLIRPGDILTILPYSGILHTVKSGDTISKIASVYDVDEEKILSSNDLGAVLRIGEKVMVPGGNKISKPKITVSQPIVNTGISIIRDLVTPSAPKVDNAAAVDSKMAWPTEGRRITQYYSWRHTGLDIANKTGTPLYAAEDGTVEFAGWSSGYGYNVVINHGNSKKTRYAHASQLFVKAGDSVSRGENIAAMGSTGWSTGPHIHFEVIINGKKYNPLNYIK